MEAPKLKRFGSGDGTLATGFLTRNRTLFVEGTATAKAKVTIFDDGVKIGTAKAEKAGNWSFATASLWDCAHSLTTSAKFKKDTSKSPKAVDGKVHGAPPATAGIDVVAGSDPGSSATDNVTKNTTPSLSGTVEAGTTVTIRDGGAVLKGRLVHHPDTARLALTGTSYPTSGAFWVPVEHQGNSQMAEEEVKAIRRAVDDLFQGNWTDKSGDTRPMTTADEAPVCLVSMTASSVDDTPRGIAFLLSLNRINVAVSRAKGLALVFGRPRLRETKCETVERMRLVNTLCALPEFGTRKDL